MLKTNDVIHVTVTGFAPLKEALPKWIREYNGNSKSSFRKY